MISFCVIMVNVFGYRYPQMPLTQSYDAAEALSANRENESFRESVQIRTIGGKTEGLNTCVSQERPYFRGEKRIPVMNEVPFAKQEPIPHVSEVSRHLLHPIPVWVRSDTADAVAASGDVDDKQNMVADEAEWAQSLDCEQVCRGDSPQM